MVTYYWYPFNNPGTFRWTNFNQFIDFDVLTCRRPLKSFVDYSIEARNRNESVFRFGWRMPAVLWGFIAPFIAIFRRYDRYIFTSPPESMLIGAYVMQCLGKTVIIDMRDSIERERQTVKILVPLYRFFYRRMKNVIVSYQFLDETKPVVYHGYEELDAKEFQGYYNERVSKKEYNARLLCGYIPDQSFKPTGYSAGSVQTFRHLGFPVNNRFHAEIHEHKLVSVRGSVKRLHALIKSL